MKNLIIPMGGKSSRFPGMRPKWMLTHPLTGNLMCVESIRGINLDFFDQIYFVFLKEHEDLYNASEAIKKSIRNTISVGTVLDRINTIVLDMPTNSQAETVYTAIQKTGINGFIYIKDSDGYSNGYWGWGAEDDDVLLRCSIMGVNASRKDCGYRSLSHDRNIPESLYNKNLEKFRDLRLAPTKEKIFLDGLETLSYEKVKEEKLSEFCSILDVKL